MLIRNLLLANLSGMDDSLPLEEGWAPYRVDNVSDARALLQSGENEFHVGVILTDESSASRIRCVEDLLLLDRCMEWIIVMPSGCLKIPGLCEVVANGSFDYHTHPVDPQRMEMALGHAYGKAKLKSRIQLTGQSGRAYNMIGESPPMQKLYEQLGKIQNSEAPVLIIGESGTGKELAARAIHQHSTRNKGPFVAVNCGALPGSLIQSELFGYEKGAFTGAARRSIGRLEAAAGGTIFLDEIGDLHAELQVNLLRFLQEKTIERIGSNHPVPINVRIVSATHTDLEAAVKQGDFREDLFYRLHVLTLRVPPLRERGADVELLARAFLDGFSREGNLKARDFSRQALDFMHSYYWPGNVRELINRIQKAVILSENRMITVADLGFDPDKASPKIVSLDMARQRAELESIRHCLAINNNNVSKAARHLGISRMTMYRLMSKFSNTI